MAYFQAYFRGANTPASVNRQVSGVVGAEEMTRRYDHIFKAFSGDVIPVSFLRALAYSESHLNPRYELDKGIDLATRMRKDTGKRDSYWGLFQVGVKNVLEGFNKRSGKHHSREQLFDPVVNTEVATWHLRDMLLNYAEWSLRHGITNLRPDWNNQEFVRLFVAGWNSGHSRASGVQAAALWLHANGLPVTHDNIFLRDGKALRWDDKKKKYVEKSKTKFLKRPAYETKYDWQRLVARRYFQQRGVDTLKPGPGTGGAGGLVAVLILAALGIAAIA